MPTKIDIAKRIAKLRGMPQASGKKLMELSKVQLEQALRTAEAAYVESGGRSSRPSRRSREQRAQAQQGFVLDVGQDVAAGQRARRVAEQQQARRIVAQRAAAQAAAAQQQGAMASLGGMFGALRQAVMGGQASSQAARGQARGQAAGQTGAWPDFGALRQAITGPAQGRRTQASRKAKLTKPLKSRAGQIVRAIEAGRVAVRDGLRTPADVGAVGTGSARERYEVFVATYKGATLGTRRSRSRVAVGDRYEALKGKKYPYYLVHGYTVPSYPVGGGRRGPGVIRPIPGSGAEPFMSLPDSKKRAIVDFLNGSGRALRSRGSRRGDVSVSAVVAAHMETRKRASRKSRKAGERASRRTLEQAAAAGGANRWW